MNLCLWADDLRELQNQLVNHLRKVASVTADATPPRMAYEVAKDIVSGLGSRIGRAVQDTYQHVSPSVQAAVEKVKPVIEHMIDEGAKRYATHEEPGESEASKPSEAELARQLTELSETAFGDPVPPGFSLSVSHLPASAGSSTAAAPAVPAAPSAPTGPAASAVVTGPISSSAPGAEFIIGDGKTPYEVTTIPAGDYAGAYERLSALGVSGVEAARAFSEAQQNRRPKEITDQLGLTHSGRRVFAGNGSIYVLEDVSDRPDTYWQTARPVEIPRALRSLLSRAPSMGVHPGFQYGAVLAGPSMSYGPMGMFNPYMLGPMGMNPMMGGMFMDPMLMYMMLMSMYGMPPSQAVL